MWRGSAKHISNDKSVCLEDSGQDGGQAKVTYDFSDLSVIEAFYS